MVNLKQNRGITLVALVITIIVLLILAGITINLTLGQNGILTQAQNAGIEHEKATVKEKIELAILDIKSNKLAKRKQMVREDLKELESIGATIESTGIPAEGEYNDYYFEIDEDYKVEVIGKVQGEKPAIQAQILTQGIVAEGGTVEIKVTASINEGNVTALEATNGATLKAETSTTEKTFTVSANGTYTFKVTSDNGRSNTASVEVNTIIEKPSIEIKDITKTGFTIAVTNNYTEGLITEYKYYVGGTVKSQGTTNKEFAVTELTAETTYSNVYVEAYIGETKLTSEVTTVTTKPIGIEYSWEELEKIAEVISDNDDTITNDTQKVELAIDGKTYKLEVGETTKVSISGTSYTVRILGFNHDTLTNTAAYGEGKENTYAGISFEFVDFIMKTGVNSTSQYSGVGWGKCELRNTLNTTTINSFDNNIYIKQVNKKYFSDRFNVSSESTCSDWLWLLSCSEIWDNGKSDSYPYGCSKGEEGEQYKFYKNIKATWTESNTNLIKNSYDWWLRSQSSGHNGYGSFVESDGAGGSSKWVTSDGGIAPGFAI